MIAPELPDPAPLPEQRGDYFRTLVEVVRRLLAPDGCPWDREQTFESMRRHVLEEACEVIDAIESGDRRELREELGDLAMQVAFLAELGRAEGAFGPDDALHDICSKLVRRHPHVFAGERVDGTEQVLENWEAIKTREKGGQRGVLDGVPRSLPALLRAQTSGEKVRRVGFDWDDARGPRSKVDEELAELDAALAEGETGAIEHELGDVLLSLVSVARHHGVDAEQALRKATDRFQRRFEHVEACVRERHGGWPRSEDGKPKRGIPAGELERYWEAAKSAEAGDGD